MTKSILVYALVLRTAKAIAFGIYFVNSECSECNSNLSS
jgi:hypothetical protein